MEGKKLISIKVSTILIIAIIIILILIGILLFLKHTNSNKAENMISNTSINTTNTENTLNSTSSTNMISNSIDNASIISSRYEEIDNNLNGIDVLFVTDALNKVWDTDVTYLIFKGARAYLSTIIDLYDRHVIAYKVSKNNDNKLVMDTLNEALKKEKDVHGLIIHSDQGFQYTSYEYKAICESKGIQISMSRKGSPIDDSPIESWHALLKKETLYNNNNITSLQEYIDLVENWIEFYNTTRLKDSKK